MLAALLAGLVLAAPDAPSPLQGCTAIPVEEGWEYECGLVAAAVNDEEGRSRAEALELRDETVERFLQAHADDATRSAKVMKLGGQRVEVLRIDLEEGRASSWIAAIPHEEGSRSLHCTEPRGSGRCVKVLAVLADGEWRGGAAPGSLEAPPPPLEIAGRAVEVPDGCRGIPDTDGGKLECGASRALWLQIATASLGDAVDRIEEALRGGFTEQGWDVERDEVDCRLAGRSTTCRRFRFHKEGAPDTIGIVGGTRAGGSGLYAYCAGPEVEPVACGPVFELE